MGMQTKWQKICDSADWFDPGFLKIITDDLRSKPILHRKQWEFAMIYRVLNDAGLLNDSSTGIAFGAGKERLIYSVMQKVKKLVATDLYDEDSKWVGTKTNDPKNYLLENAPFEVDPDRLDAKYMNMREISFPDETFDFAYSSCVFEHISDNDAGFIEHLNEVKRTLKEGGLYVMTTEYNYADKTASIPGSYFFELNHLLEIVKQSGLHLAPIFDANLTEISANEPTPLADDFNFHFGSKWMPHVTCLRQNLAFTSCLLALTKNSHTTAKAPEIIGYERSMDFVNKTLKLNLNGLWNDWQKVSPYRGISDKPSIIGHENFEYDTQRTETHLAFHSPFFKFGTGRIHVKISIIPNDSNQLSIKLFSCYEHEGNEVKVESVNEIETTSEKGEIVELSCHLKPDRIYAVLGRGAGSFKSIDIQMKKSAMKSSDVLL